MLTVHHEKRVPRVLARRLLQIRHHLAGVPVFGRFFALPLTATVLLTLIGNLFVWRAPGPYVVAAVISTLVASGMFLLLLSRLFPIGDDADG